VIAFVHEYARPWGRGGWRGAVQAATQRALLHRVVSTAAAVVVTTDERADWLQTRRWLPRRTVATLPVPSNVAPVAVPTPRNGGAPRIGLFGYAGDAPDVTLVAAALARMRGSRPDVELVLIGAPGPASPAGDRWRAAASAAGVENAIAFTGVLPEDALSQTLAGLDAVVVADDIGPTARRATLAAALAHGRAIVAVEGPRTWRQLVADGAVALSPRDPESLARELDRVLTDDPYRAGLERRARAFYDSVAAPNVVARRLRELIEEVA
jgi:glycosyltransferase involved in cell wall biosynthesis